MSQLRHHSGQISIGEIYEAVGTPWGCGGGSNSVSIMCVPSHKDFHLGKRAKIAARRTTEQRLVSSRAILPSQVYIHTQLEGNARFLGSPRNVALGLRCVSGTAAVKGMKVGPFSFSSLFSKCPNLFDGSCGLRKSEGNGS